LLNTFKLRNIYLANPPMLLLVKLNKQLNVILSSESVGQFAQLSASSLSGLQGKKLVLLRRGMEADPIGGWKDEGIPLQYVPLKDGGERRDVAALDSSVIQLAEAEDGSVYAAKAAIAFNVGGTKNSVVVGPNLFYLGEDDINLILRLLEKPVPKDLLLADNRLAMRMIRVVLERALAYEVSAGLRGGLLLLDGSFRASAFEPRGRSLFDIVEACGDAHSYVAGFSKRTSLRPLQKVQGRFYDEGVCGAYVEVTGIVKLMVPDFICRSFMARLTQDGVPFRVDLGPEEDPDAVLSATVSSDVLVRGYPESLRAAHFLSVFSEAEEAIVKSQLTKKARVTILPSDSLRRAVLGPLNISGRRGVS